MTIFLLVISLLLNGVAIFSIIILYARQNRLLEIKKSQEQMVNEMEEVISSYLFEIKEENEEFIKRFHEINTNHKENKMTNEVKINLKEDMPAGDGKDSKNEENKWAKTTENAFKKQAVKAYKNTVTAYEDHSPAALLDDKESPSSLAEINHSDNEQEAIDKTQDEIYREFLIKQVQLLQDQGLSIDNIAKKMNRGKTEIELLLKFN